MKRRKTYSVVNEEIRFYNEEYDGPCIPKKHFKQFVCVQMFGTLYIGEKFDSRDGSTLQI